MTASAPLTDDTRDDQALATTPAPLTQEEAHAQLDVIVAALREIAREDREAREAQEAA